MARIVAAADRGATAVMLFNMFNRATGLDDFGARLVCWDVGTDSCDVPWGIGFLLGVLKNPLEELIYTMNSSFLFSLSMERKKTHAPSYHWNCSHSPGSVEPAIMSASIRLIDSCLNTQMQA